MNPLNRTVKQVIAISPHIQLQGENKKAFQLVKYVTGKKVSQHTDYNVQLAAHYGDDTITISGARGFLTVSLRPLFQEL